MAASLSQRSLRALFGLTLGGFQVVAYYLDEVMIGLLEAFPQAWVLGYRPFVTMGDLIGFWGPNPAWAAWLYAAAFTAIGVAGFLAPSEEVRGVAALFLAGNLVVYWVSYLPPSSAQFGGVLAADAAYSILMLIGLSLFIGGGSSD